MKKLLSLLLFSLGPSLLALACPVCEKNQPRGFTGITHGVGPEGLFDYVMLYGAVAIVVVTFALFLRYLLRPNRYPEPPTPLTFL